MMASKQNDKTIQFWDNLYATEAAQAEAAAKNNDNDDNGRLNNNNNSKEWILQPTDSILEKLYERLVVPPPSPYDCTSTSSRPNEISSLRVLEIGCGTSTLSKQFWQYCHDRQQQQQQQQQDQGIISVVVSILATDVSRVCIQQLRERDEKFLTMHKVGDHDGDDHGTSGGSDDVDEDKVGRLDYQVLDITKPIIMSSNSSSSSSDLEDTTTATSTSTANPLLQLQPNSFDMILDKGCLDTFSFRSRQRGEQKDALVETVLNNVHSLLKNNNNNNTNGSINRKNTTCSSKDNDNHSDTNGDSSQQEQQQAGRGGGIYVILSPRSKFKTVRDYSGFSKVERTRLNVPKGELVGSNSRTNNVKQKENDDGDDDDDDVLYMYTCWKKNRSSVVDSDNDNNNNNNLQSHDHHPSTKHKKTKLMIPPSDTQQCPRCKISFIDFRKGEALEGKGVKYWTRRFHGHGIHCKGSGCGCCD